MAEIRLSKANIAPFDRMELLYISEKSGDRYRKYVQEKRHFSFQSFIMMLHLRFYKAIVAFSLITVQRNDKKDAFLGQRVQYLCNVVMQKH